MPVDLFVAAFRFLVPLTILRWPLFGALLTLAADTVDVRIGVVAFADFRAEQNRFSARLGELSRRDPKLRFQIAVGTYGDVLHWIRRRSIR